MLRGISEEEIDSVLKRLVIQSQFGSDAVPGILELLVDERAWSLPGQVINVVGAQWPSGKKSNLQSPDKSSLAGLTGALLKPKYAKSMVGSWTSSWWRVAF